MKGPVHVRALSLVFALTIVIGGWLVFEYGNHHTSQVPYAAPTPARPADQVKDAQLSAAGQVPTPSGMVPENFHQTYKCEKGGRIRFGDQPCGKDEKMLSVASSADQSSAMPDTSLARMKATVAELEAARLERERRYAAANLNTFNSPPNNRQAKEFRCQQIDREIASIDAKLRLPHSGQWGDYLTGERKKLTDERFTVGC